VIKSVLVAASALGLGACGDINAAALWPGENFVHIEPELRFFDSFAGLLEDGGVLVINAGTVDTSIHIRDEDRVSVSVTTTSGDVESVDLEREVCGVGSLCAGFSVAMRPGLSVETLYPHMAQFPYGGFVEADQVSERLPARITRIASFDRRFGVGYVWRKVDMPRFISLLQDADGVESVQRGGLGCGGTCPPWHSFVAGYRPLDDRAPRSNNGWIEAHPGDTITISYSQPSGAVLTHRVVMR